MHIQTARLNIRPLTRQELELYFAGNNLFEQAQGLTACNRELNEDIKHLIRHFYLPALLSVKTSQYVYYTVWIVVDRATRQIVAEFGFKGAPVRHSVEIGYDTFPAFRQKGYISEAISGVIEWLKGVAEVAQLTAETHHANTASIKVLARCRFSYSHSDKTMLYWKIAVTGP